MAVIVYLIANILNLKKENNSLTDAVKANANATKSVQKQRDINSDVINVQKGEINYLKAQNTQLLILLSNRRRPLEWILPLILSK